MNGERQLQQLAEVSRDEEMWASVHNQLYGHWPLDRNPLLANFRSQQSSQVPKLRETIAPDQPKAGEEQEIITDGVQ